MKVVSLFSGAGGLDLGARAAGAEVIRSIEADHDCCETLKANGFDGVVPSRIEGCPPQGELESLGLREGELDLLMGGPPCQPFSKSAFWASAAAKGLQDPRASTLDEFCKYAAAFRPKALLLENVEGFRSGGGLDYVLDQISNLGGYAVSWAVLNAADYGVAQRRRRLFIVAVAHEKAFQFPLPSHGASATEPAVTAWEALQQDQISYEEDLKIRGRWSTLVNSIPEGRNYLWHTDRGGGEPLFGWRTRYWSFLLKLKKSEPAPTIVASPSQNSGPFHWTNRLLSTAELAALQSFPSTYRFMGDRPSRQRQIGNAVPPLLGKVLIQAVAEQIEVPMAPQLDLRIPRASHIPAEEATGGVPPSFLELRGLHAAHPGTGRGPRPRADAASGAA
jgi:DNA (cytosine-5)-methyltransferase 1